MADFANRLLHCVVWRPEAKKGDHHGPDERGLLARSVHRLGDVGPGQAGADEGLFRDLSLDRARQTAAEGGKRFVLVDFYTVWCGPCKKLDETTWKDQDVRDWLSKEAVCLKVDAEKDEPLAGKYRINVYPTVLLLRPDGTEIDRLVGYRDAKTFLADAREALAGNDSLTRARKKLEGANANDPMLRMSYGDALRKKGGARTRFPSTSGASTMGWSMARASRVCGSRSCWARSSSSGERSRRRSRNYASGATPRPRRLRPERPTSVRRWASRR